MKRLFFLIIILCCCHNIFAQRYYSMFNEEDYKSDTIEMNDYTYVCDTLLNYGECAFAFKNGNDYTNPVDCYDEYSDHFCMKVLGNIFDNPELLKEVPQKPDYPPINESSYVAGYNACIDKILEGSEQNEID